MAIKQLVQCQFWLHCCLPDDQARRFLRPMQIRGHRRHLFRIKKTQFRDSRSWHTKGLIMSPGIFYSSSMMISSNAFRDFITLVLQECHCRFNILDPLHQIRLSRRLFHSPPFCPMIFVHVFPECHICFVMTSL